MRSFIGAALVLTIATSLCACTEPESTDALDPQDKPDLEFRDHTSGGSSGLPWPEFRDNRINLVQAAKTQRLLDQGTTNVSAGVLGWLDTPAGLDVLSYAVACSLPDDMVVHGGGRTFVGRGHMIADAAWANGPLDAAAIRDLMACMVTHVNAVVTTVPIQLNGPDVGSDPVVDPEFTVSEAKWVAIVNADNIPFFYVWPSSWVSRHCVDVAGAFKERVCGQSPTSCNLAVGPSGGCVENVAAGGWFCGGLPAIETKLKPAALPILYKSCP